MGIFSRFRDIVNSNINAMLEQAEDPEKLIRLMIQEMEDTLIDMKASCAGTIASRKRVQRTLEAAREKIAGWEQKARLAVAKGREELAREALLEKRRLQEEVEQLDKEETQLDEVVRGCQGDIAQLEEKLTTAREKQRVLVHRHVRAQQRTRAQEQIRRAESSDAWVRYEQIEARIERMEAEADLVNVGRKPSLEEQFAQLEQDEEIERELQTLKHQQQAAATAPAAGETGGTHPG